MAPKFYEMRVFRDGREASRPSRFISALDFDAPDDTMVTLTGILLGAAARDGKPREAHMYYMDIHRIGRHERVERDHVFRYALPVEAP